MPEDRRSLWALLVLFASQMAIFAILTLASTGKRSPEFRAAGLDFVTIRAETTIQVDSGKIPEAKDSAAHKTAK